MVALARDQSEGWKEVAVSFSLRRFSFSLVRSIHEAPALLRVRPSAKSGSCGSFSLCFLYCATRSGVLPLVSGRNARLPSLVQNGYGAVGSLLSRVAFARDGGGQPVPKFQPVSGDAGAGAGVGAGVGQ